MMSDETLTFSEFEHYTHFLKGANGRMLEIPLRRGVGDSSFIDQITFSFHERSIDLVSKKQSLTDDDYMISLSAILERIFGFGITKKNAFRGRLFYQSTWHLGDLNCKYGTVHYGGQNDTVAVEITAEGCIAAKSGWEVRLYEFLQQCERPKITRCDIAHDFLDGEYSPDMAMQDFDNGGFSWTNRTPKSECRGTDWRSDDGTGKTFYIGSRLSSKYTRIYEKGKQLGDKLSRWTRFEVEFKAHDILIPFEVLLRPGEFLGGAYPICQKLFQKTIERISSLVKKFDLSIDKAVSCAKQQVGALLNFFLKMGFSADEIISKLRGDDRNKMPKRLNLSLISYEFSGDLPIHRTTRFGFDPLGLISDSDIYEISLS